MLGLKGFKKTVMTAWLHKPCLCMKSDKTPKAILQQQDSDITAASNQS